MGHATVIMHTGIASIKGNSIKPMLLLHRNQFFGNGIKGLFPADLDPAIALFFDWQAQTIRIRINILHRRALGANITATQRIIFIPLNRQHLIALSFNFKTADSFTEITGTVMSFDISGHLLLSGI